MSRSKLFKNILQKNSFLCIGLDTDIEKIPEFLKDFEDPIFEFNKRIIDATKDLCVAYKPNIAFYEAEGIKGWQALEKTINYIPDDILIIADAKRGDIGNTSERYAKAFFENLKCDAITVAPYMGVDSVTPFYNYPNKWVIVLGLTSNVGSQDFQLVKDAHGDEMYKSVLKKAAMWGTPDDTMFVIGATHPEKIKEIRELLPRHFFLVPGVGAQGGSLKDIAKYGMIDEIGLLVNSSRSIIYAGNDESFDIAAREKAMEMQKEMEDLLYASMMGGMDDDFSNMDMGDLDLSEDISLDLDFGDEISDLD